MDEKRLDNRLRFLANALFIASAEGKEFIKLMKLKHVNFPVFPQPVHVIKTHGGAVGWAAYRAGQLELLYSMELMAQEYLNKIDSENRSGDSK